MHAFFQELYSHVDKNSGENVSGYVSLDIAHNVSPKYTLIDKIYPSKLGVIQVE